MVIFDLNGHKILPENFYLIFIFFVIVTQAISAPADSLPLPVYRLIIDMEHLHYLYNNPGTDQYFPATFYVSDTLYPCSIRFRGATAR